MGLKNKSMYAILGVLSLQPSSGYDIKKYSDNVFSGFWNENFGHIYPTLKKMLEDGMIETVSKEDSEKKVKYRITEKGTKELEMWLVEDTVQQPVRSEFMLKLLFSNNQPKENVVKMLHNYQELHEKQKEKYLSMEAKLNNGIQDVSQDRVFFLKAVLRRGIISSEGVIQWCQEILKELQ